MKKVSIPEILLKAGEGFFDFVFDIDRKTFGIVAIFAAIYFMAAGFFGWEGGLGVAPMIGLIALFAFVYRFSKDKRSKGIFALFVLIMSNLAVFFGQNGIRFHGGWSEAVADVFLLLTFLILVFALSACGCATDEDIREEMRREKLAQNTNGCT